jgi:hypothetical protein
MSHTAIPIQCPRCQQVLYPVSAMRPHPRGSLLAKALLGGGGLLSAAILWGGWYLIRIHLGIFVPTGLLAIFLLIPALIPGILLGLMAARLPQALTLRCSSCGWWENVRLSKRGSTVVAPGFSGTRRESATGLGTPRSAPASPAILERNRSASPFDEIVDDGKPVVEAKAWIYAEFLSGRSPEELTAELVAQGWPAADAETLVEEGRRLTRQRRGVVTRDQVVEELNEKWRRDAEE